MKYEAYSMLSQQVQAAKTAPFLKAGTATCFSKFPIIIIIKAGGQNINSQTLIYAICLNLLR